MIKHVDKPVAVDAKFEELAQLIEVQEHIVEAPAIEVIQAVK